MSANPSSRNRAIFSAVRVQLQSYQQTAEQFQLSKSRVYNIVKQVERWLAEDSSNTEEEMQYRLKVREAVHRERLEHLFAEALAGWQRSQQPQQIEKRVQIEGKPDRCEQTTRSSAGDRRFLEVALRLELARQAFEVEAAEDAPKTKADRELEDEDSAESTPELDPYWQPWPQTAAQIARRRERVAAYVKLHPETGAAESYQDITRIESRMIEYCREKGIATLEEYWPGEEPSPLEERGSRQAVECEKIPNSNPAPQELCLSTTVGDSPSIAESSQTSRTARREPRPPNEFTSPRRKQPSLQLQVVQPILPVAERRRRSG